MRRAAVLVALALCACTPTARHTAAVTTLTGLGAAAYCAGDLLGGGKPDVGSLLSAAGCWLAEWAERLPEPRPEAAPAPTVELGEAVWELAAAERANELDPCPENAEAAARALAKCEAMAAGKQVEP